MPVYTVEVEERIERTVTVEARDRRDALARAERRDCWLDETEHGSVGVEATAAHEVAGLDDEMDAYKRRLEA